MERKTNFKEQTQTFPNLQPSPFLRKAAFQLIRKQTQKIRDTKNNNKQAVLSA